MKTTASTASGSRFRSAHGAPASPEQRLEPTLDDIVRDPQRALGLPRAVIQARMLQCLAALGALTTAPALAAPDAATPQPAEESPRLLTPAEAAARFNVSKRWLLAHARAIPGRVRLTRKTVRFDEARLGQWITNRGRLRPDR